MQKRLATVGIENAAETGGRQGDAPFPGADLFSFDLSNDIPNQIRRNHTVAAHGGKLSNIRRWQAVCIS